jgi:hypothetical protein
MTSQNVKIWPFRFQSLRGPKRRSNLGGERGLPRPDKSGLAMTKSEVRSSGKSYN